MNGGLKMQFREACGGVSYPTNRILSLGSSILNQKMGWTLKEKSFYSMVGHSFKNVFHNFLTIF